MNTYYERNGVTLIHGDCLNVMRGFAQDSFEACITDPPYPRKYLHLYSGIAEQLPRILRRGGSFMAIAPHYAIPEIFDLVNPHMKYRWTHAMWQEDGQHPRMAMGIEVMWKPIVWWVNEAWPQGRGFKRDGFRNGPPSKEYHEWEQSLDWANFCLDFIYENGPVLDPLAGAGTLLVAAALRGIPAVGIEIDESSCEKAAVKLDTYLS